jgi:hypothetical protein
MLTPRPAKGRSAFSKAGTFARLVAQQRREATRIRAELPAAPTPGQLRLTGGETTWLPVGLQVEAGTRFQVAAAGALWVSAALAVGIDPRTAIWVRIGGTGPIRKLPANTWVFTAWAAGPVEVMAKGLSEWSDPAGGLLPGKRKPMGGGIEVSAALTDAPANTLPQPNGWDQLWRIGDGTIFTANGTEIAVSTHGDVGILCRGVDLPLLTRTTLSWQWLIEQLPSRLPEDLGPTHDYLSIAVEFENGRDLTYMWSAGLPHDHIFPCPLGWWCDRETHWVVRTSETGLGAWQSERRMLAEDYAKAIGGDLPERAVNVWLIANSVFQRRGGQARFRDIVLES